MPKSQHKSQAVQTSTIPAKYKFTLHVHVHDSDTGKPIKGAQVDPVPLDWRGSKGPDPASKPTNKDGVAEFELRLSGCKIYDLNVDHPDYYSESTTTFVAKKGNGHLHLSLEPRPKLKRKSPSVKYMVNLYVHVSDYETGNPIAGASVDPDPRYGDGSDPAAALTDGNGIAHFLLSIDGTEKYDIPITHSNYNPGKVITTISNSADKHVYKNLYPL